MELPLNPVVLENHKQIYPNSCVTMCVEFALKLMDSLPAESFDLQNRYGDCQKSGEDFDGETIFNVFIKMHFNTSHGPSFPLEDLFDKIKSELDNGNYVNCALKPNNSSTYHAYLIYGYKENEFLAITKYYDNNEVEYISDMKSRLENIKGSDILTFKKTTQLEVNIK